MAKGQTGRLGSLGRAVLIALGLCGVGVTPTTVDAGVVAVYEDWRSGTVRPDRWTVREGSAQDMKAEVHGRKLRMRYRAEGLTFSDRGFTVANHILTFANPVRIDRLEADLKVTRAEVTGCAANPGLTRLRPVAIGFNTFNDGTSTAGLTGDHIVRLHVNREADSLDPPNVLTVQAFVGRCLDPTCSNANSTLFNLAVGTVTVGTPFTLRLTWDRPLARFVVAVDNGPEAVLTYDPALDTADAHVPFADLRMQPVVASCTAAPAAADAEIEVYAVRTNADVVIE
jgi:hypothetical protein